MAKPEKTARSQGRSWWILLAVPALAAAAVVVVSLVRDSSPSAGEEGRVDFGGELGQLPVEEVDWDALDDPGSDGWETEVFNNRANSQLYALGKLIAHPEKITEDALAALAAPDYQSASLIPANVTPVFRDEVLSVARARPALAGDTIHRHASGLGAVVRELVRGLPLGAEPRFKFKLFRVEEGDASTVTRQYFSLTGTEGGKRVEQNALWAVEWVEVTNAAPRIRSIRVEEFEQVTSEKPALFADCTRGVIGGLPAYRDQFLLGFNHWLERLQDTRYFALFGAPGLAVGDVNGDGLEDLYVCQEGGLPNRLLLQNPDGTARDSSVESGVDWVQSARSALFIDLDGDADQDLVVAFFGNVVFAANDGRGRFEVKEVLPTVNDTFSMCAADYDADGDVDVYVCAYNRNDLTDDAGVLSIGGADGQFVYHDANNGGANALLRNELDAAGKWGFRNVTAEVGLDANNRRFSFAAAWEDYDNDGDQDLYVANDFGRNNLYRNEGGTFVDVAATAGVEDSASGMAVTWADVDHDGWMDVHVSNMFSAAGGRVTFQEEFKPDSDGGVRARLQRFARGNSLFKNAGDGTFEDTSEEAGITMGRWAWGSNFLDVNNDGWDDLIVANGYITTDDTGDL